MLAVTPRENAATLRTPLIATPCRSPVLAHGLIAWRCVSFYCDMLSWAVCSSLNYRNLEMAHPRSSLCPAWQLCLSSGTGSSRAPAAAALEGVTCRALGTPSPTCWLMLCPWALLALKKFILIALLSGDGVTVATCPAAKSFHS